MFFVFFQLANKEKQIFLSGLMNDLHESHYDVTVQDTSGIFTQGSLKL